METHHTKRSSTNEYYISTRINDSSSMFGNRTKVEKKEAGASTVKMANGKTISASLLAKLKNQIAENEMKK